MVGMSRTLILGATSWIGGHLLRHMRSGNEVWGTSRTEGNAGGPNWAQVKGPRDALALLDSLYPEVIVNLLRGEDNNGLAIHRVCTDWTSRHECFYVYASSALALDGYDGEELTENLRARSISDYGMFKQECENVMLDAIPESSLVLRFSSIHGWAQHKVTRTERLLMRLQEGRVIRVDEGVVQNRLFDEFLTSAITELISRRALGVIHLGAASSSDELDFLRRIGEAFGYDCSAQIVGSGIKRGIDLALVPGRILDMFGPKYHTSESETIRCVREVIPLVKYLKSSS